MKALFLIFLALISALALLMRLDEPERAYYPLAIPSEPRSRVVKDVSGRSHPEKFSPSLLYSPMKSGNEERRKRHDVGAAPVSLSETDDGQLANGVEATQSFAAIPVLLPAAASTPSAVGPSPQLEAKLVSFASRADEADSEFAVTALAPRVPVFGEPHFAAATAPFEIAEGETLKPLVRLRQEAGFDWYQFDRDGNLWWAPAELFVRLAPPWAEALTSNGCYEIGWEPVDRFTPLPPHYAPHDLVPLAGEFVLGHKGILLRKEAAAALQAMLSEARREGLTIYAFSGYRDFATQKRLYLEAVAREGPKQKGTAAPGYSEHQLGTTVDLTNSDPRMILSSRFGDTSEGQWLFRRAADFGFIHSYTEENSEEAGYKPEPWHLRYVGIERAREILATRALSAAGGG